MNLDQIRAKIGELRAAQRDIERAWPSADEHTAGIAAEVAALVADGRRALNPAWLRKGKIGDVFHSASLRDVLAVAAALDPERITKRLVEIAREEYPEPGLSSADRGRRLAEIDAELRRLEIEEERLIRSSPTPIVRRGDAHPAVVLAPDLDRLAA